MASVIAVATVVPLSTCALMVSISASVATLLIVTVPVAVANQSFVLVVKVAFASVISTGAAKVPASI